MDTRLLPSGIADDRTRAIAALLDRLDALDLAGLLPVRAESAPTPLLDAIAWELDVLGLAGWDLATTEAQKRAVLRGAVEMHRARGTPWAIRQALSNLGWPSATIDDAIGLARYDGTYRYDGDIAYGLAGTWALFAVQLGAGPDGVAYTSEQLARLRGIIETWKNARSRLIEMSVQQDGDETLAIDELPMTIGAETPRYFDGSYDYDGAITYGPEFTALAVA